MHMNQQLAKDIWNEKLAVEYGSTGNDLGNYTLGQNKIVLSEKLLGGGREASAKLATVMSHEGTHYNGKRVEGLAHLAGAETYAFLNNKFTLQADTSFSMEMLSGIMNTDNWKENTGDVDHWTLMANGDLVEDEDGWLRDQNGNFIRDKNGNKIGANGIETGLLNILFGEKQEDGSMKNSSKSYSSFSDEQIAIAQDLMYGAGFTNDGKENPRDVKWNQDKKSGNTIKADLIADDAGNTVATQVFMNIFDNLTNGMIDNTSLRYTAFQSYSREDYAARLTNYFSAKYTFYNGEHKLFNNTDVLQWTQDFGKSNVKDNNGEQIYADDMHKGIDIWADEGTDVYAYYSGKVVDERFNTTSSGYSIIMEYGFNFENQFYSTGVQSQFMHFSKESNLKVGDFVMSNIKVGEVGHTGTVSGNPGNHLHYQLMGNLQGFTKTSTKWNMLNDRRNFFLNKFGATDSYYANGDYKNYYYDINNIQERLGL